MRERHAVRLQAMYRYFAPRYKGTAEEIREPDYSAEAFRDLVLSLGYSIRLR